MIKYSFISTIVEAVRVNDIELAKKTVNQLDASEDLILSIEKKDIQGVKKAIDKGADLEFVASTNRRTPLFVAANEGSIKIVKLLVEKGANIYAEDDEGVCVALYAWWRGGKEDIPEYLEIIEYLRSMGLDTSPWYTPPKKKIHEYAFAKDHTHPLTMQAITFKELLDAHKRGYPDATYELSLRYASGSIERGIPRDEQKSLDLLKIAYDKKYPSAIQRMKCIEIIKQ